MPKALNNSTNYLKEVRNQYESHPYPPRNPEDENKRLCYVDFCNLDVLNHYCYSGKKQFDSNFRVLIAGGGTGDETITIAEQLRNTDAKITHLDISQASIDIAKERTNVRRLTNVTWHHGSILDVEKLGFEKFDFISCSGVLHHLESPEKGLEALNSVLKNDGAMGIMLYGKCGRTGVYQMQDLMKIINKNEDDMHEKVVNCNAILKNLPETNWFKSQQNKFSDSTSYGDVGIYDLFLHSNDRAYSVPEIYKFLSGSNLNLIQFLFGKSPRGNNLYKLESYINNDFLLNKIKNMDIVKKQAAAELLCGEIVKHVFYAMKKQPETQNISNTAKVPFISEVLFKNAYHDIYRIICETAIGKPVPCLAHGVCVQFVKDQYSEVIWKYLDGKNSIKEIFEKAKKDYEGIQTLPDDALNKSFSDIFNAFNLQNWMLLKDKNANTMSTLQVFK